MRNTPNLYSLLDMNKPDAVFKEAKLICSLAAPTVNFDRIDKAYADILCLFAGHYPGYRESNTGYHDLFHTTDVTLAAARLLHGAFCSGRSFCDEEIHWLLLSALMHDTGYIQHRDDAKGTGAKYTAIHIDRSIDFIRDYFRTGTGSHRETDVEAMTHILRCTGLNVRINDIPFQSDKVRFLGLVLGTADLVAQMADRYYIEKLPILYNEFQEGRIGDYESDFDLIQKTPDFYQMVMRRFQNELDGTNRFMENHFRVRWNITEDLYAIAIRKNLDYLTDVVLMEPDFKVKLKRDIHHRIDLRLICPA